MHVQEMHGYMFTNTMIFVMFTLYSLTLDKTTNLINSLSDYTRQSATHLISLMLVQCLRPFLRIRAPVSPMLLQLKLSTEIV